MLFTSDNLFALCVFGFITALAKRVGGARGLGADVIVMLCMNTVAACNVREAVLLGCGGRMAFY